MTPVAAHSRFPWGCFPRLVGFERAHIVAACRLADHQQHGVWLSAFGIARHREVAQALLHAGAVSARATEVVAHVNIQIDHTGAHKQSVARFPDVDGEIGEDRSGDGIEPPCGVGRRCRLPVGCHKSGSQANKSGYYNHYFHNAERPHIFDRFRCVCVEHGNHSCIVDACAVNGIVADMSQRNYQNCRFGKSCDDACCRWRQCCCDALQSRQPSENIDTESDVHVVVVVGRRLPVGFVVQDVVGDNPQRGSQQCADSRQGE